MPVFSLTKTYANGNVLTEADLDNLKNSIETALNVTKLDDSNLQADGISIDKLTPTARSYLVPAGMVGHTAATTAPSGWLLIYGQEVSQATYATLFTAIGTTYNTGGEGVGNFRLPDARGRAIFGQDDMGGTSANRITAAIAGFDGDVLGASGGSESAQSHTHGITGPSGGQSADHTHSISGTTGNDSPDHDHTYYVNAGTEGSGALPYVASFSFTTARAPGSGGITGVNPVHQHSFSATSGGTSAGHTHTLPAATDSSHSGTSQNMPPAFILNAIIKT